jgi:hypothetical protein
MLSGSSIKESGEGDVKDTSMELKDTSATALDVDSSLNSDSDVVVYRLYKRRFVGLIGLVCSTM